MRLVGCTGAAGLCFALQAAWRARACHLVMPLQLHCQVGRDLQLLRGAPVRQDSAERASGTLAAIAREKVVFLQCQGGDGRPRELAA